MYYTHLSCPWIAHPIRQRGMGVIEWMMVLAILAALAALSTPSFRSLAVEQRASGTTNSLRGALALARSEAVKRGLPVFVSSRGQWDQGWDVWVDEDRNGIFDDQDLVLSSQDAIGDAGLQADHRQAVSAVAGELSGGSALSDIGFDQQGRAIPTQGARLVVCPPAIGGGNDDRSRGLRLSPSGRIDVVRPASSLGVSCS